MRIEQIKNIPGYFRRVYVSFPGNSGYIASIVRIDSQLAGEVMILGRDKVIVEDTDVRYFYNEFDLLMILEEVSKGNIGYFKEDNQ